MLETKSLRRMALVLVAATLLWNLGEAGIALWVGVKAGSVSLLAFGLDSVVELLAGGILMWRLTAAAGGEAEEAVEQRARKLVAVSFFFLAAYVVLHSGSSLLGWLPEPQPSLAGIILVLASAVVMSGLYVAKMRIATRIQSRALRAEALESLFCDLQDVAILVGLGLNALAAWWWADPVAALVIVPLLVKEGLENLSEEEDARGHDETEREREKMNLVQRVCFCLSCFFGLRSCRCLACAG